MKSINLQTNHASSGIRLRSSFTRTVAGWENSAAAAKAPGQDKRERRDRNSSSEFIDPQGGAPIELE